ncbi:hypothetical protein F5Y19DRAFT_469905 [Xylariaceae sp. FL1651]|nr:hypothetical protein F5Y19DRAFT_469905 [Xylariaceae sp. FL1651]
MLRSGGTTVPSGLEVEVETHRPRARQTEAPRHFGINEQQTLTFDYYETIPLESTTHLATDSNKGNIFPNHSQHQRQQSAPSFSARRINAPSLSPTRVHSRHQSQGMTLTGDGRRGNSPGRFAGWLGGTSTPPAEGDTTLKLHQARTQMDTTPRSVAQSRLGFLASSVSAFTSRMTSPTQTAAEVDDEICKLDIEAALFPASSPLDRDTFSPAAYKNLEANAVGLLHKMQDAYRQRTVTLQEIQAEREAQREELEETELRTRNFKNQLEKMATKAAEQEKAMQQLVAELQAEKRARHEERISREKIFRGDEGSMMGNEDLCVDEDERKRWRKSNGTVKSDMSIDTDGESAESESVFSRSRSPTAMTCATENESLDVPPSLHARPNLLKPRSAQQLTAFQRLVKGISAVKEEGDGSGSGTDGCRNCRGQDSSVAWDTVSLLRDENIALKQRVAHLEVVVEGALDVVNGIKI